MTDQLYFDEIQLSRGNFFSLHSAIETDEGVSYEIEDWINRGGNASIFRGRRRSSGEECAIKFLMKINSSSSNRFLREITLLKSFRDDHVTHYYGSGKVTVKHNKTGEVNELPFLVMELADCNLSEFMQNKQHSLTYEQYAGQFRGLAKALAALHEKIQAVHRDLKPENILIAGERWLLSDYGLCTYVNPDHSEEDLTQNMGNVGPKFWLSPEAHNRRLGHEDEICAESDVFQLAAIFWYVATGRHPCGIVTEEDWTGPEKLFPILYQALYHDHRKRPQSGEEFYNKLVDLLSQ